MDLVVRALTRADLAEADRINRLAFGTFFGLANPMTFRGDGDLVNSRFAANPDGAFMGELDGRPVACGFVMDWGSVAVLGPLTVDVEFWGRGMARAMMAPMIDYIDAGGFAFAGLLTHPQSASHVRLYEAFGFWMQRITGVMSKTTDPAAVPGDAVLLSAMGEGEVEGALRDCRDIAGSVYPGLDLGREIETVRLRDLGDTLILRRGGAAVAFAVCHHGAMTEGSSTRLLVKFAAVRDDAESDRDFRELLAACEGLAAARGAVEIVAGANSGRTRAYRVMTESGFRTVMNGILMTRPDTTGYNREDAFVIDDWR